MNQKEIWRDPILKMDILMWRVIKLLIRRKKHILERFGLTCSQFDMLSAINHYSTLKSEIIQINLSEKTDIDPMTTSTILRNLEKKGLITRRRNIENTRTIIVRLTDEGIRLLEEACLLIKLSNMKLYENVDKEHLISQLLKLYNKLNKD